MPKLKLIKSSLLIIMLCTILINIFLFYLYHSPIGLLYTTISGLIVVILYAKHLFISRKSRIILFGLLATSFLYALYLFFNQVIIENRQVFLLLTATVNLLLIFSSIGLIVKAGAKSAVVNLKFCFLMLFIIGSYNFFTLIAQRKTSSDYNISFVIFLLVVSSIFLFNELITLHFNSVKLKSDKAKSRKKAQHMTLENPEAIQTEIDMFFRDSDAFTSPDFSFDDFVDAISFTKKEVSIYLNHYKKTSFYELLGEERAKHVANQLKNNHLYSIEGIIQESGFKSHTSLISYFKKVYGMSPSEYRSKHLN